MPQVHKIPRILDVSGGNTWTAQQRLSSFLLLWNLNNRQRQELVIRACGRRSDGVASWCEICCAVDFVKRLKCDPAEVKLWVWSASSVSGRLSEAQWIVGKRRRSWCNNIANYYLHLLKTQHSFPSIVMSKKCLSHIKDHIFFSMGWLTCRCC